MRRYTVQCELLSQTPSQGMTGDPAPDARLTRPFLGHVSNCPSYELQVSAPCRRDLPKQGTRLDARRILPGLDQSQSFRSNRLIGSGPVLIRLRPGDIESRLAVRSLVHFRSLDLLHFGDS